MRISCSDDQWINSYHKMSFSYNLGNLMVNYADIMRKNCMKEATVHWYSERAIQYLSNEGPNDKWPSEMISASRVECLDFTEKLMTLAI